MEYKSREEVPEKYKWDLTAFFKDEEEFNQTYQSCREKISKLSNYKGQLKNSNILIEFLDKYMDVYAKCEDLYVYSYLIHDQVLGVPESIDRLGKTDNLLTELEVAASFFENEIVALNKEDYKNLFENEDLIPYQSMLDDIYRNKEHILTDNEEKIVAELVNAMDNYSNISSNLLSNEHDYGKIEVDGKDTVIATNNYRHLLKNKDKNIRKTVYDNFNKVLSQYAQTSSSLLSCYVKYHNSLALIRHFSSSWEQKLFNLKISNKVFETLVKTTEDSLDSLHNYYKLQKEILKLDTIHSYDTELELTNITKEYNIEEAQKLIMNAIKPLGDEYSNKFKKIFDNHYIDYCQYKGKCSGAYSFCTINNDSRILMSYNDNLDSISTIIHEGGHNVHHQYIVDNVLPQYREVSSLICEVASLTNECLLSHYLLENGTKEEKLAGLNNIIDVIIHNYYGAVREGKMEEDMYKYVLGGNSLTKDYMNELCLNSLKKYYGGNVELDDYSKNSWINRSHYYMNFYLYSYAICVSVATTVATKIVAGDKVMLDNYIKFLGTGSDICPMDAFKILGIELEDENVYLNIINYFNNCINRFREIFYN